MDTEVIHNEVRSRYELQLEGQVAAYAEYVRRDGTIIFTHTFTVPPLREQGLAAIVVQHALDDSRRERLTVVPQCWYVAQFITAHPEYHSPLPVSE